MPFALAVKAHARLRRWNTPAAREDPLRFRTAAVRGKNLQAREVSK